MVEVLPAPIAWRAARPLKITYGRVNAPQHHTSVLRGKNPTCWIPEEASQIRSRCGTAGVILKGHPPSGVAPAPSNNAETTALVPRPPYEELATMRGLMMDTPLLISSIIDHGATVYADQEIVSRTVEGPIHR